MTGPQDGPRIVVDGDLPKALAELRRRAEVPAAELRRRRWFICATERRRSALLKAIARRAQ